MAKKILIATHGKFASGIGQAVELLLGKQKNLFVIDAYVDESDYTSKVNEFFQNYDEECDYLVFTDLFGGSVNQKLILEKRKHDYYLLSGFNLPLLLELIISETINDQVIKDAITNAQESIVFVDEMLESESKNDDGDDFF